MKSQAQRDLLALWRSLQQLASPATLDEALTYIAGMIHLAFDQARILFYLEVPPPEVNPYRLLPCPARYVTYRTFVSDRRNSSQHFSFEAGQPYYLPLALPSGGSGYLFVELDQTVLADPARTLLVALAAQTADYLARLGWRPAQPWPEAATLRIEKEAGQLWLGQQVLSLSPGEATFLYLLEQQQGQPCPREILYENIYAGEVSSFEERQARLDSLVARLRQKLDRAFQGRISIKTVRGMGYRLHIK